MTATKKTKTKADSPKDAGVPEFAVIETGGKQYRVEVGDELAVEMEREVQTGDNLKFDKVLLVDNGHDTSIGTPYLDGASVEAEVTEVGRAKKIEVMRFRSKSRYFKNKGHRQPYMKVKIKAIK